MKKYKLLFAIILAAGLFVSGNVPSAGAAITDCAKASCPNEYSCLRFGEGQPVKCATGDFAPPCDAKNKCRDSSKTCMYNYTNNVRSESGACFTVADPKPAEVKDAKYIVISEKGANCPAHQIADITAENLPAEFDTENTFKLVHADGSPDQLFSATGITIPNGSTIRVPQFKEEWNTRITVKIDGSTVYLEEASRFTIPCIDDGTIEVEEGLIHAIIKLVKGEQMGIQTKNAIGGIKGTDFIVDARDPNVTQWYLKEGSIEIAPINTPDKKFLLTAGNSVAVSADKAEAPRPISDVERALFVSSDSATTAAAENPISSPSSGSKNYFWYVVLAVIAIVGGFGAARKM